MKKLFKRAVVIALALCLTFSLSSCGGGSNKDDSGYIVTNAAVYTADGSVADTIVIKNGLIEYVGDAEGSAEYDDGNLEKIDAKGGSVLPGMVDGHMHPAESSISYYFEINLADGYSADSYIEIIKGFIEEHPDNEVYIGSGYMRSAFDSLGPTKEMLDEVCADKPVIIMSGDGHSKWVNSKALELAKITKNTENPANGIIVKDDAGEPTGYLKEAAMNLVDDIMPEYTIDEYKEAIAWLQGWFNSLGVTTVYDGMVPIENENYWKAYEEMAESGELTIRVRGAWHLAPEMGTEKELLALIDKGIEQSEGFKTDYFKVIGFKFFADQVLEEETAYLDEPYLSGENGIKTWDDDLLENLWTKIDAAGYQIHVHQIGDAAATYALDTLEKVKKANGNSENRTTFVHVQFVDKDDIERMAELGVSAMIAPYWAVQDDYYYDVYTPAIGEDRVKEMYPEQSFFDAGVNVGVHSDFLVTEPDWGWLLYSAVTRALPQKVFDLWYEGMDLTRTSDPKVTGDYVIGVLPSADERLSLDEIIKAATYGGAYSMYLEDEIGTIEAGKKADLVIMDMNITDSDIEDVSNVQIMKTFFDGKLAFDAETATE